jgi:hypothetical protein
MSKSIVHGIGIGIYNLILGLLIGSFGIAFMASSAGSSNGISLYILLFFSTFPAYPFVLWLWEIALFARWREGTLGLFGLCLLLFLLPVFGQSFICTLWVCIEVNWIALFAISGAMMLAAYPIVRLKQKAYLAELYAYRKRKLGY